MKNKIFALAAAAGLFGAAVRAAGPAPDSSPAIARSNADAQPLLSAMARFVPEMASRFGVAGFDDKIFDLGPNLAQRQIDAVEAARAGLEADLAAEKDPAVRQDLEIMIQAADENNEGTRLGEKYNLPYFDVPQVVFFGIRGLLDDRVSPDRRKLALVRLEKYAGMRGGKPITELAEERIREKLANPKLLGPFRGEVEKNLGNAPRFIDGVGLLFPKYKIAGWEKPYARLKEQMAAYDAFVRKEVLPRARTNFRLPPEQYVFALKQAGVDMPVGELTSRAKASFREIQNEMQTLAPLVATQHGFSSQDYRDVIADLKKDRLSNETILAHYEGRIKDLEKIIEEHHIVTLPDRPMKFRLASEAESSATPAPHMSPPRLIGNTGEMGEFVLPLEIPGKNGQSEQFDDFNFAAASWTLTAHEGRPGHELQFSTVIEKGVSIARAIFAFNSTNVEGWGLYAEAEAQPYEPLDGQLIACQHRLLRAARAFLDPGLQMGEITPEEATRVLRKDVCLSEALANEEVERYTFWAPGQAPSYFCGYQRLMALRTDAERILGTAFDRQRFNDFVLSQGLLPPSLLRKAVMEEFVPLERKRPGKAA
jgi:hypothetical protein